MAQIGVAEAARRLGVGVPRVHQRIVEGSLPATKIGAQWVIDESVLPAVQESRAAGRPLSQRSAWALVAVSEGGRQLAGALDAVKLAPVEWSRARQRMSRLVEAAAAAPAGSEEAAKSLASVLRSLLRNRAQRRLFRASPRDLVDLRADRRLALSGLSDERGGISAGDLVEAYVAAADVDAVADDFLLSPAGSDRDANVVLHVVPAVNQDWFRRPAGLLLAADLAEHRRPREEARAAEILREFVRRWSVVAEKEPASAEIVEKARAGAAMVKA